MFASAGGSFGQSISVGHVALLSEGGRMAWQIWALGPEPFPPGIGPRPRLCGTVHCQCPDTVVPDLMLAAGTWVVPSLLQDVSIWPDPKRTGEIRFSRMQDRELASLRELIQGIQEWPMSLIISCIPGQSSTLIQYLDEFKEFKLEDKQILVVGEAH